MASQDEVRDLDLRLTELEFRMRLVDGAPAAEDADADGAMERRLARERERRERELPETSGRGSGAGGRAPRWRRARRQPEAYD